MVRNRLVRASLTQGSPHTRGDGPQRAGRGMPQPQFSPHAWGWSGRTGLPGARRIVLSTRVGMVRLPFASTPPPSRSPHTRGDIARAAKTMQSAPEVRCNCGRFRAAFGSLSRPAFPSSYSHQDKWIHRPTRPKIKPHANRDQKRGTLIMFASSPSALASSSAGLKSDARVTVYPIGYKTTGANLCGHSKAGAARQEAFGVDSVVSSLLCKISVGIHCCRQICHESDYQNYMRPRRPDRFLASIVLGGQFLILTVLGSQPT